jgi:chromosome segregation ATPase
VRCTGFEQAQDLLEQLRAGHDQCERFLNGLFDPLESLLAVAGRQAQASPDAGAAAQSEQRVLEAERQRASLEQERAVLETELETLRQRVAELTQTIDQQKRALAEQQARWSEELRPIRRLMEMIAKRLAKSDASPPAETSSGASGAEADKAAPVGDPVLESVLAQFEMLQRDVSRRRAALKETS